MGVVFLCMVDATGVWATPLRSGNKDVPAYPPGKGFSSSHGARPVHQLTSMISGFVPVGCQHINLSLQAGRCELFEAPWRSAWSRIQPYPGTSLITPTRSEAGGRGRLCSLELSRSLRLIFPVRREGERERERSREGKREGGRDKERKKEGFRV